MSRAENMHSLRSGCAVYSLRLTMPRPAERSYHV